MAKQNRFYLLIALLTSNYILSSQAKAAGTLCRVTFDETKHCHQGHMGISDPRLSIARSRKDGRTENDVVPNVGATVVGAIGRARRWSRLVAVGHPRRPGNQWFGHFAITILTTVRITFNGILVTGNQAGIKTIFSVFRLYR